MLKLMKYEFIHSMRSFLISFCVFWGACLLLPLFTEEIIPDIPLLSFMVAFGFTVLVMGISLALIISIFTHYYHSMFKRPAYLTLTLPVSSLQLISSKLIVSFIWLILGGIALFFGIFLMGIMISLLTHEVSIVEMIVNISNVLSGLWKIISQDILGFMNTCLMMILEVYAMIITIYFSLTVVHTKICRHHRVVLGIVIWIFLGIFINWARVFVVGYNVSANDLTGIMIGYNLFNLIYSFVLTFVTVYILDHYIEIE